MSADVSVVDGGWSTHALADHAAYLLSPLVADATIASHVVGGSEGRRICLVTATALATGAVRQVLPEVRVLAAPLPGPEAAVATAHVARSSGRLVVFAGEPGLRGRLSARDIVSSSAIDAVVGLAGALIAPPARVDLGDFVRPVWRAGRCELLVQEGSDGLVPFEVRDQIACCADH